MIPAFLILYIVSCICSAIGFYKFIWFLSVGYGSSVAALGVALLIIFHSKLTVVSIILCILCIIYGIRLASFLFVREKNSGYINNVKNEYVGSEGSEKKVSFIMKLGIWLPCAFVYVCEVSAVLFRLQNEKSETIFAIIGIVISALGIITEALADQQKSNFKKKDPKGFCNVGLFRIVHCPNYLGEITFWFGLFIYGIPIYQGVLQWIAAIFGFGFITLTMISAARSIEKKHESKYGNNEVYRAYADKTPILIPLIPLYTLNKK